MKCVNCKKDGLYIYHITKKSTQTYCGGCLPKFLEPLRKAGNLKTTEAYSEQGQKNLDAIRTTPIVEKPIVEPIVEAVVEETIVEEKPKPKKKSAPKKAENETTS